MGISHSICRGGDLTGQRAARLRQQTCGTGRFNCANCPQAVPRLPSEPPLPHSQEYGTSPGRVSPKIKVAKSVVLPPESQTWVTVTTRRRGRSVIQQHDQLYANANVPVTNGVVQVEPDRPFRVLIANFASRAYRLAKNQVVGIVLPHPTAMVGTHLNFADVLGIAEPLKYEKKAGSGEADPVSTPAQGGNPSMDPHSEGPTTLASILLGHPYPPPNCFGRFDPSPSTIQPG